ncbi:MAG: sensor histidine kinase [Caldilineaceae bacterium]|nr:sensor histidine kinase [Caldilineaceae bacterium]
MDSQVNKLPGLLPTDLELLRKVEAGLPITADVSRADVLLCTLSGKDQALIAFHAIPNSISSLYRHDATGRTLTPDEQPLLFQALRSGSGGRRQREVLSNGAPVIQDVYPIHNNEGKVIGAMVVETNMIAHERQRRRHRHFRQAVVWMQEMCARGELESAGILSSFSLYDGIYLVDSERTVIYMSGIAANMFRSIGVTPEVRNQPLSSLEPLDGKIVEQAISTQRCQEIRHESDDGRIWLRIAIPLRMPSVSWRNYWLALPWTPFGSSGAEQHEVDAVLVLLHNATEAVQKERELNVKSAIIQEVHHRVKNNLQNIAAILRIQARRIENDEARQYLTDAVNRVLSMSVIHEFLSQDQHRPINIKDVCQRIAAQVAQVSGNPEQEINVAVQGSGVRLPASQATPVSMVVNELLLNAVEHGIKDRMTGNIRIVLDDLGDAVSITVEDDGDGLPPNFDFVQKSNSLGLQIVHTLVTDDLKGSLRIESIVPEPDVVAEPDDSDGALSHGTRAIVKFPKRSLRSG